MELITDPGFHMWFVLGVTLVTIVLFVQEKVSLEITSIGLLTVLLLFGQVMPLADANGRNMLDSMPLLAGFANPSLIAVLALLVMGQAMIKTGALRIMINVFQITDRNKAWLAIFGVLIFVTALSAFLNNTPLVVIAIPLVQALAVSAGVSDSRVMIPLSYAAILGGMMTLIGSSTNLLVSSTMQELGYEPLAFFDFFTPGMILAGVGLVYVVFVVPRLLPDRSSMVHDLAGATKEFVAELDIADDSKLIGEECERGKFSVLGDLNVRLIQRGGHLILPPFEGYKIESGDVLIVAATREGLMDVLAQHPGFLLSDEEGGDDAAPTDSRMLAEIMITPASRVIDMSMDHVNFERQFGAMVLGIQRRAKVVRRRLGRIRLEAGDVLLVAGRSSMINAFQGSSDFIVLSGSKRDLPKPGKSPIAALIFLATITLAALGILTIPAAAIAGAVAMIATGCLNFRQATRAIDRKIFFLVGAMLGLGHAMQVTGSARFIAEIFMELPFLGTPFSVLAALFLLIAVTTNVLTNNACAILFTPIAMNIAGSLAVPPEFAFDIAFVAALTVIFASNCSFASPIGYQTNLLVMGPGHYRFRDFLKAGVPLVIVLWLAFMGLLKFYFGL